MAVFDSEKICLKNNREIIFRHLEHSDVEKYSIFSEMIASETSHTLHYPGQIISLEDMKERLTLAVESPFQLELGGFCENRLISLLSFFKPRPYHPYEKHIGEFGIRILEEYCRYGLGSKMLLAIENVAKKMDVKRIQGRVRSANHIGINFYQKHGYQIEGLKKYAVLINGVYQDEFYIYKILE